MDAKKTFNTKLENEFLHIMYDLRRKPGMDALFRAMPPEAAKELFMVGGASALKVMDEMRKEMTASGEG